MRKKGERKSILLEKIKKHTSNDFSFASGRVLGSMCSVPHPFARKVFLDYIETNIGDAGLCPGIVDLEKDAIRQLGSLLNNDRASGNILTGGTEANIAAMWCAKNISGKNRNEVILSETAHFSFDKAAGMMDLNLIKIPVGSRGIPDAKDFESAITDKTMAIVGIAGATGTGLVDPISDLSVIAEKYSIYLHIDAAFGGFVLPFLERAGYPEFGFDFTFPGVSSITLDPHKMGRACIPSGCILFRNKKIHDALAINVTYLSGGKTDHHTIVSSRSGASVLAAWSIINYLGEAGYTEIVKKAMDLTCWLKAELTAIDTISLVCEPAMNIIGFRSSVINVRDLFYDLRREKFAVALFPEHLRIVLMPHVSKKILSDFLAVLKEIITGRGKKDV